jgi:beta-galactosidase GanA
VVVERYRNRRHLLLWNLWNEPRSRPVGECGCPWSVKAYRQWLEKNYASIDRLNDFFGKRWESFETVEPPGMPRDYAEFFLWRKWALAAVTGRLEFMYETVSRLDDTRPIIAHVGACSMLQDVAGDGSDDLANAATVDFYGTSFPTPPHFTNVIDEAWPSLVCDWLRNVSAYFWVYELYPDWGNWNRPVSREDFSFKVWSALAGGAKGLLYWQYRAERVGNENNLAGLVHIDGRPKAITGDAGKMAGFIRDHERFLLESQVEDDGIGLLYSVNSDLISRIENTGGPEFWDFSLKEDFYLYKQALIGAHALFRELGYTVRWLDVRNLRENLARLQVLYLPEAFILTEETVALLAAFVGKGGKIIAEEGLGLRQENTWLQPRWPMISAADLFGIKIGDRVAAGHAADQIQVEGFSVPATGFAGYLELEPGTELLGAWRDGRAAVTNKNGACFVGTSLGAAFHEHYQTHYDDCLGFAATLLETLGIKPSAWKKAPGLYFRRLRREKDLMLFVFNRRQAPAGFALNWRNLKLVSPDRDALALRADGDKTLVTLAPLATGVLTCET